MLTGLLLAMSFDSLMLILLPLVGSVMLAYGVTQVAFDLRRSQRKVVMERLKSNRKGSGGSQVSDDIRKQGPEFKGAFAAALNKFQYTEQLQRTLEQANLNWSAPQVLVNLTATAICIAALLMVFGMSLLISVGAAAAVFFLPLIYFSKRRKWRMNKLVEQLPDVFELLSQALRAGHSLASGMQLISTQVPEPSGTEFGRVFHEQNLGLKIEHALKNMAERVDMLDVRFFVTAVLIQRQTGGDLSEVLDKIGTVIRARIKLQGTVMALTAEGRLSGLVLMALPPVCLVAMMFMNPDYGMMLFNDPIGKMLLAAAGTMQAMGWLMIQKIINIKV